MKYYVCVSVKSSTTRLGELLTAAVLPRFDGALLTVRQAKNIPVWLEDTITQICKDHKRLKPMKVRVNGYFRRDTVVIDAVTEKGAKAFDDNRPFTIYLYPVRKDHVVNTAWLREYDDQTVMDAAYNILRDARLTVMTTLGRVKALKDNEALKAVVEAIEEAVVEIAMAATEPLPTNETPD